MTVLKIPANLSGYNKPLQPAWADCGLFLCDRETLAADDYALGCCLTKVPASLPITDQFVRSNGK